MREHRLGDDIDDFCVRCKRIMNHSVVSVIEGQPAKVRCRTCHSDHDFRHEQAPPPKVDMRKQALFNDVLKSVDPTAAGSPDRRLASRRRRSAAPSQELRAKARQLSGIDSRPERHGGNCSIPNEVSGKCGAITTRRCKFSGDAV